MKTAKISAEQNVPARVLSCLQEYDPGLTRKVSKNLVAVRESDGWFAMLLASPRAYDEAPFHAIDFVLTTQNGRLVWELSNDDIPFDSVEQFKSIRLTHTL